MVHSGTESKCGLVLLFRDKRIDNVNVGLGFLNFVEGISALDMVGLDKGVGDVNVCVLMFFVVLTR